MKPGVFVFRKLPHAHLVREILAPVADVRENPREEALPPGDLIEAAREATAFLPTGLDPVGAELIAAAPGLRVIGNFAVGYNNIDVAEATRRGIAVTNTPGVLTAATAELTWALILAAARRVVEADAFVRAGKFEGWRPGAFLGMELAGKTLGIVGFGQIGQAVARQALGFGMRVVYFSRRRADPEVESALRARPASLEDLLAGADVISIHTPLTPETRHLIGEAELRKMKPTVILVNTARGPVVDEGALVRALRDRRIAGAGLDVYEDEPRLAAGLTDLPNVVLLPHAGSATLEAREGMARLAALNIKAVLTGERPPNLVNPEAWKSA